MENKFTKNNLIARWIDNRLDDDEKNELEKSGELEELKVVLEDIDTWKLRKFDIDKGLEDLEKRKKFVINNAPAKQKSTFSWIKIAASVLILISSSYFFYNYFSNPITTIETSIAQNKTINLPNGSTVSLDALSKVSYQEKKWKKNRIINLRGQGYFDVTKGSSFTVKTSNGFIKVLGTQFNVKATKNVFEVICYEGKVSVETENDTQELVKGESAIIKENKLLFRENRDYQPDWINGFSKYEKTPLYIIMDDLKKYYNVKIALPQKYKSLKFSGTITHSNVNIAFETLFNTMEIEYDMNENNVITIE